MRSLEEIKTNNEDAVMDAIEDESRPIIERVDMWLGHSNTDLSLACDLLIELMESAKALEQEKSHQCGNMAWWYENQINPIRKALGLTEMDYILDAVLALKARNEELEDRLADDLEARNAANSD